MITSGSIRKRNTADGKTWQITIELPADPVTGKRIRKYKSVKGTKKEAERAMHEYIRELEKGYYVTDSKITISEWIDTWLEVYIVPNVSPTTLSRYQGMIKRYIKPLLGHMQVQQLNTLAVQNWVNGLKISPSSGKPMAAATIKHTYHVLKGCMDKAVLAGIISRSPCVGVMLPKGQKKAAVIYDENQIKQLLEAAKGTEMELVLQVEVTIGLRRGELLGLQWQDIDFEKRQLHVVRNRVIVNGRSIVKEPKTANSVRTIDLPLQLVNKLKLYQWESMANKQRIGMPHSNEDFVFIHSDTCLPIYPEYMTQLYNKLTDKVGLPHSRFHDLRHMCASIMLRQGVDMKAAMQILGHSDISTTYNIYTHLLPSAAREVAEKMGSFVFESA